MSLRTAVRRAAAGGCGCNGRVAVAAARAPVLAARYSSAAVARTAVVPRFAAFRSFTTTSPTFKEARVAWAQDPFITYEELKPLTERPTDDILLVDVREPDEVALGSIPSAVNLPLSRLDDALDSKFNPGTFQNEFAFSKPLPSQKIIFFCRSGKRSATAAEFANGKGYPNTRNYVGSMLDWAEHEGLDPEKLGL